MVGMRHSPAAAGKAEIRCKEEEQSRVHVGENVQGMRGPEERGPLALIVASPKVPAKRAGTLRKGKRKNVPGGSRGSVLSQGAVQKGEEECRKSSRKCERVLQV